MKFTAATIASLAAVAVALPAAIDYTPKGGWDSIDWTKVDYSGVDWSKIDWTKVTYPPGTGSGKPYQPPTGGSKPAPPVVPAPPATVGSPFTFTSYREVKAVPGEVVDATGFTGGLEGASGLYKFGFNSIENVVCYNITLYNFRGDYSSPATTATHIHEAARGVAGPPRIAFPNPVDIGGNLRRSLGCLTGPFRTGVNGTNGQDSGIGFTIAQIEANPAGFFADVHSSLATPGAVRGQLA